MTKRLFIFAGYDKDNIVDATLTHYLNALSKLGDIVFTMDTDLPASELSKITEIPNVLHATASRHGEYDFGSYKRGYTWARDNKLLSKYDWIYLVNDSVIGPLWDITAILTDLESRDADMVGLVEYNGTELLHHMQSWFVGLRRALATEPFFEEFMLNIKHLDSKELIVFSYEIGMSQLILQHGYKSYAYSTASSDLYNDPVKCIVFGIPFVKKLALHKALQTYNMYSCVDENMRNMILNYAQRIGINQGIVNINPYKKVFRLTLLAVPIITIYCKSTCTNNIAYKVKLFDFIPVMKIARHKHVSKQINI